MMSKFSLSYVGLSCGTHYFEGRKYEDDFCVKIKDEGQSLDLVKKRANELASKLENRAKEGGKKL